jgi:hypothetical protein
LIQEAPSYKRLGAAAALAARRILHGIDSDTLECRVPHLYRVPYLCRVPHNDLRVS